MLDPALKDLMIFLIALVFSGGIITLMIDSRLAFKRRGAAMEKANEIFKTINAHYLAIDHLRWMHQNGQISQDEVIRMLLDETGQISAKKTDLIHALREVDKYTY